MYQLASQPQSMWRILIDSFKLYKESFGRLLFWAILLGIINFLSTWTLSMYVVEHKYLLVANPLIIMLLSLIPISGMTFDIYEVMHQRQPTLMTSWSRALAVWPSLVGTLILYSLIFAVYFAVILMIGFLLRHVPAMAIPLFFIFFCAFIYVMVRLFAWYPLIITERQGIFAAFKNSFKNTKGSWWRTFALLFVAMLIIIVVNFAIAILFKGAAFPAADQPQTVGEIIANICATVVFIPWLYGVVLLQIHNLDLLRKN